MVRTLNRRTIGGVTFLVTALLLLMMTPGAKAAAKVRVGLSVSGSAVEIGGSGLLLDATGHVIAQVDDRSSLELTASGGQVWLERRFLSRAACGAKQKRCRVLFAGEWQALPGGRSCRERSRQ